MDKKTFSKFLCACITLLVFVIGALSCASSSSAYEDAYGFSNSSNASKDGAQVDEKSADDIINNVNLKYELN